MGNCLGGDIASELRSRPAHILDDGRYAVYDISKRDQSRIARNPKAMDATFSEWLVEMQTFGHDGKLLYRLKERE